MSLPGGPANVNTTDGLFLVSAAGYGNLSAADLIGQDQETVKAVYKNRFVNTGGSVWGNPSGPLAMVFDGVTGGLWSLILKPLGMLVTILVTVLDSIPVIGEPAGDFVQDLAAMFGLMKSRTTIAQNTGEAAQTSADNANVGVARLEGKVASSDVPGGVLFDDTFGRTGANLGTDYDQANTGPAGGTLSTDGNNAVVNPSGNGITYCYGRIKTSLATDYNGISVVQDTGFQNILNSGEMFFGLRCDATRQNMIAARLWYGRAVIGKYVGGTWTQLATANEFGAAGDKWKLLAGTDVDVREILLFHGSASTPLLRVIDTAGALSVVGSSNRFPIIGEQSAQYLNFLGGTNVTPPPAMQSITAYDRLPTSIAA